MKTTTYTIKALCMTALLGSAVAVHAQEDQTKEKELNRQMTLEREYDPTVQDANKVNTLPEVKEPEVTKRAIDYATFTLPIDPEKEISLLPSGNVMTDIQYNKRRGYFNFGGGTHLNLNGDIGYHILSTDRDKLNIWFSHRSTNGNVKYIQEVEPEHEKVKAKINDNLGGIGFSHLFRRATLDLGARYGYSAYNYYGLPFSSSSTLGFDLADRNTRQVDQTIQGYVGVRSAEGAPMGYDVRFDYTHFGHKYGASADHDGVKENTIALGLDLFAPFNGNQRIGIALDARYFNYSLPPQESYTPETGDTPYTFSTYENHFNGVLNPYYRIEGDNWHVKLGAKLMLAAGFDYWDGGKFYASPDVSADVTVARRTLLYAKVGGEMRHNSMYSLTQENRYADPLDATLPSFNWLDAKLGLKCGAAPGFWFDVFAGYAATSNDYYFMAYNPLMQDQFNYIVTRSDIDSKRFYVGADLKYSYQKLLDIHLKGVYNNWTMNQGDSYVGGTPNHEIDPIGKPEMELTAGITLRPVDRVSASLDYYLATGRNAEVFGTVEEMDNINELNLTGAYTLNDTFGLYLKLNNVLCQKYELYYGYPMQSFSAMIGVNINF